MEISPFNCQNLTVEQLRSLQGDLLTLTHSTRECQYSIFDILKRQILLKKSAFRLCASINLLPSVMQYNFPDVTSYFTWEDVRSNPWGKMIEKNLAEYQKTLNGPYCSAVETILENLMYPERCGPPPQRSHHELESVA